MELQNDTSGWSRHWDDESKTPFIINGQKLIAYDDEQSITAKVEFAMKQGLAGAMVWSIDTDDFRGDCSKGPSTSDRRFNDNFPLMRTINEVIVNVLNDIERDKENEIPDQKYNKNTASVSFISSILILFVTFILY